MSARNAADGIGRRQHREPEGDGNADIAGGAVPSSTVPMPAKTSQKVPIPSAQYFLADLLDQCARHRGSPDVLFVGAEARLSSQGAHSWNGEFGSARAQSRPRLRESRRFARLHRQR